jgi:hypothetical protein
VAPAWQKHAARLTDALGDDACAGHALQFAAPLLFLNVPGAHALHGPPSGPEKPALHWQSVGASEPASACECGGQDWQDPSVLFLYVPAEHGPQGPPSAPENPSLHLQARRDVDALSELELAGQGVHACEPDAFL